MEKSIKPNSSYGDKLVALIPTEVIALYFGLTSYTSLVPPEHSFIASCVFVALGVFAIIFQYSVIQKVESWIQKGFVVLGFLIWAYSLKAPAFEGIYYEYISGALILVFTFAIPGFYKAQPEPVTT